MGHSEGFFLVNSAMRALARHVGKMDDGASRLLFREMTHRFLNPDESLGYKFGAGSWFLTALDFVAKNPEGLDMGGRTLVSSIRENLKGFVAWYPTGPEQALPEFKLTNEEKQSLLGLSLDDFYQLEVDAESVLRDGVWQEKDGEVVLLLPWPLWNSIPFRVGPDCQLRPYFSRMVWSNASVLPDWFFSLIGSEGYSYLENKALKTAVFTLFEERLQPALLDPEALILDAGCGAGELAVFLEDRYPDLPKRLVGFDLSFVMTQAAQGNETVLVSDILAPALAAKSFDAVAMSYVVHLLENRLEGVFQAVGKVLKPDGYLVFNIRQPAGKSLKQYKQILLTTGFAEIEMTTVSLPHDAWEVKKETTIVVARKTRV